MPESINMTTIEELKDLMEEDFPILIETFIMDCDKRLIDLNAAISNANAKDIRDLAHGFKGSSSNLGAEKLSDISHVIESMGRTEQIADVSTPFAELNAEYEIVKSYYNSLI